MTRDQFLHELTRALQQMQDEERRDVLYDYEEHIRSAMETGMSEEEAVRSLGSPKVIAKELLADYYIHRAEADASTGNMVRAVLATISLGFFNIIVVLGPFCAAVGILIAFFAASFGLVFASIAGSIGLITGTGIVGFPTPWMALFALLGTCGAGLLFFALAGYLGKWFGRITLDYLKFNLKIIQGGR